MHKRRQRWYFSELDWILILMAWFLALGLGYLGFRDLFHSTGDPVSAYDLVYLTAQLVTLESGGVTAPVPWQLQIARFALPALAAFTAIKTLAAVFLEQAQALRLFVIRGHVVLYGLNPRALLLARGFVNSGRKTVIIDTLDGNPLLQDARSLGVMVVRGDPDNEVLERAALARASQLICVHEDDRLNAEIAVLAQRLVQKKRSRILPTYLHIVHPHLWDVLQARAMGSRDFQSLRIELFNTYDHGAKVLLQETLAVKPDLEWSRMKVLVLGMGNLGAALVSHAARAAVQSTTTGTRLQITVVDREARLRCAELQQRYPQLHKYCSLVPLDLDFLSPEFSEAAFFHGPGGADPLDVVYLCLDDDSLNFSVVLALYQHLLQAQVPVFVRSQKQDGLRGLVGMDAGQGLAPDLHLFPLLERTSTPEILAEGCREVLAVSLHQEYVGGRIRAGGDPLEAVLQPWQALPELMRESNRRQVDRMQSHLLDMGYTIMPDPEWGEQVMHFTEAEIERVACLEHAGWCSDLRTDGWEYSPGVKNPRKKTHPALVSWENLPEDDREKNRIPVREFPDLLARLGFRIVKIGGQTAV